MLMIDVYATAGTFPETHQLAVDLAAPVMSIEQVPDIPMFRQNTAAFIHELLPGRLSNVDGQDSCVRIQMLANAGALGRGKQLAVVDRLTSIAADAGDDPAVASTTWALFTEAPGGLGTRRAREQQRRTDGCRQDADTQPAGKQARRPPPGTWPNRRLGGSRRRELT